MTQQGCYDRRKVDLREISESYTDYLTALLLYILRVSVLDFELSLAEFPPYIGAEKAESGAGKNHQNAGVFSIHIFPQTLLNMRPHQC